MTTPTADQIRHVGEREARQTAEAAREVGWHLPSFGKQLFLGDFRLDLIHPHPQPSADAAARGEDFCARMRVFCEQSVDSTQIEHDARIPDEVIRGLASLGAFGMKISPDYGGPGLTNLYYKPALLLRRVAPPAIAALLFPAPSLRGAQPLPPSRTAEPQ